MINEQLLARTLRYILDHPQEWVQTNWATTTPCGSAYCFAGHAALLSGVSVSAGGYVTTDETTLRVATYAGSVLDLDDDDAVELFRADNSLLDLAVHVWRLTGGRVDLVAEATDSPYANDFAGFDTDED